jgi:hypothetical protein
VVAKVDSGEKLATLTERHVDEHGQQRLALAYVLVCRPTIF